MKIKNLIEAGIRKLNLGFLVLWWHPHSFLREMGWYRSFRQNEPVDKNGKPIPWQAYSLKFFLEPRLERSFRVFEFGSGASTHWYADRVKEIIAVEHNKTWWEKSSLGLPSSATIILQEAEQAYVNEIKNHGVFDIVIIDGRWREECSISGRKALNEKGVIIWDDSDQDIYKVVVSEFLNRGFRELVFRGLKPRDFKAFQTSILYREDNCLNI